MESAQSESAAPLLELEGVGKQYLDVSGVAIPVLDGVSLRVEAGDSLSVVGPSGCGKSTLLNVIGALDRPSGGTVRLNGTDLGDLDDDGLAALRNRAVGFVFQEHHLLPQCTVLENVLIPTLVPRRDGREATDGESAADERARALLERVGLSDRLDHRPGQLSGGERQRVAVVRALINRPALLLADEPTGSLDREAAENLTDLLAEINREERPGLIVVTHALDLATRMERVYELRDGGLAELTS